LSRISILFSLFIKANRSDLSNLLFLLKSFVSLKPEIKKIVRFFKGCRSQGSQNLGWQADQFETGYDFKFSTLKVENSRFRDPSIVWRSLSQVTKGEVYSCRYPSQHPKPASECTTKQHVSPPWKTQTEPYANPQLLIAGPEDDSDD
jgi:hypothetical protein